NRCGHTVEVRLSVSGSEESAGRVGVQRVNGCVAEDLRQATHDVVRVVDEGLPRQAELSTELLNCEVLRVAGERERLVLLTFGNLRKGTSGACYALVLCLEVVEAVVQRDPVDVAEVLHDG